MKAKSPPTDTSVAVTLTVRNEIQRLAEAMMNGQLEVRGNPATFAGADAELIALVNRMLDSLVAPLHLAGSAIDEIAHGRIPPFVIDDYKGEFNGLKCNLNTLLATLYGMHNETQNLIGNVKAGKLRTRGNDWDFDGIWRELIGGVNSTLDAVTGPLHEAGDVLGRLAKYDLSARMQGQYRGEHAVIKKAMNATAESLHAAVSQVAETVEIVSDVGNRITRSSQIVSQGAAEQGVQLSETSRSLEQIVERSQQSAESTYSARRNAQVSTTAIENAKLEMDRMLEAMTEIRASADNTACIIQQIDDIAKETDLLSTSAGKKAVIVRSSASGFGVVASEIRKLSEKCEETIKSLEEFQQQVQFTPKTGAAADMDRLNDDYREIIHDLKNVATSSGLLGVNAAISAAHVEGAGNDFEALTGEIRQLARRSTDAAKQSEQLIHNSVEQARKGEHLSREIDDHLSGAVAGARAIDQLTDEIAQSTQEQASGLEEISRTVILINEVTGQNTVSAFESATAAKDLVPQVNKLAKMVSKFRLAETAAGAAAN